MQVMAADWLPTVGNAVLALAGEDRLRVGKAAIGTAERAAVGVKSIDGCIDGKHGVVIPALALFGLVIDAAARNLHLAGVVVALEIAHVVHGVPEAEFHGGEQIDRFFFVALVC